MRVCLLTFSAPIQIQTLTHQHQDHLQLHQLREERKHTTRNTLKQSNLNIIQFAFFVKCNMFNEISPKNTKR